MDEEQESIQGQTVEPSPAPRPRRSRITPARLVAILLVAAVIAGAVGWQEVMQVVPPRQQDAYVDVGEGDSIAMVSQRVYELGMTSNPQALRWYWRIRSGGSLREGRYVMAGISGMEALYQLFASGSPLTVRVTLPEGYTVAQMAVRFEEEAGIPEADFMKAATDSSGGLLEGHLFPDTYEVLYAGDADPVVARMVERLASVLPADWSAQAAKRKLTTEQLLTVASIVEREAKEDADRPLVASVIFNRLADDMLLQMDATLGYVLPSHDGFYTYAELKTDSPYNTYVHPGLPPTPICNPGLPSLQAAAHAPATAYYYFLAKPDGHCVFAATFAEHQHNMRLYLSGGH
ncbi:MAG: endolytic transglycosylase MltG [Candidatus Cryosericum sp.]